MRRKLDAYTTYQKESMCKPRYSPFYSINNFGSAQIKNNTT